MAVKHTPDELNNLIREELITMVLMMQGQLDTLNQNIEKLIEQVRIANNYRFGRRSETLNVIDGQLSFFDDADAAYDESVPEPDADDVLPPKRGKKKGQRNLDLMDFPEEIIPPYSVSEEQLDEFFGKGNWRVCRMKPIRGFGTNRSHGLSKYILLRSMSEQMVTIRMNSCVGTDQRTCSETALLLHHFWLPS